MKKNEIKTEFNYTMWSTDTTKSLAKKKKNPKTMESTIRKDIIKTLLNGRKSTYCNEKPAFIRLPFFYVPFDQLKPSVKVEFEGGKFSSTTYSLIGSEFTYNGKIHVTMVWRT